MRRFSKRVLTVVMALGVVSFSGGCGKIAEKAAEKAIETAVESDGGNVNVDIDSKTGKMTIKGKGPDGESVDIEAGEGGMTIQGRGPDGNVDIKVGENGMTMQGAGDGQRFEMKVSEGQMTMTTEEGAFQATGDDNTFTIATPEGTLEGTSGPDAKIPEEWPKTVPVYAGAKVLTTTVMAQMGIYSLELETSAGMADVVAYYEKELSAKGWKQQQSFAQGAEATMMMYVNDEQMLNVTVTAKDGPTKLMLMLTKM